MFKRILNKLRKKRKQVFLIDKGAEASFTSHPSAEIINTNIVLRGKSTLTIHENVKIDGYGINLNNGSLTIGKDSQLVKGYQFLNPGISIDNGALVIGACNIIKADINIRFGGICSIGTYNAINEQTEIRCDESVSIGDHNMISYECMIYDTNTHVVYPPAVRRARNEADFPYIGIETEKPNTKPVVIGNDNWLGKRCAILKGCSIGNEVIVGTQAVASNINVNNAVVAGNPAREVKKK